MSKARGDQSFDDRATHLQKNIYGSDKGRLRLLILQRDLDDLIVNPSRPLSILDAGCGAGLMSEWALENGHHVTACDSAEVMLSNIKQRLGLPENLTLQHTTIQDLSEDSQYDVIFCHALLEWVENHEGLLTKLQRLVKPDGMLSLMFYNAWAREMAQLVYGNFDYIDRHYQVRQRVKMSPHYPAFPDEIEQQLQHLGFGISTRSGIRVFYDIMRDTSHHNVLVDDIIRHELRISQQYPYWQMGRYVHFLAKQEQQT